MQGCNKGWLILAFLLVGTQAALAQTVDWPWRWKADPAYPNTLVQIARALDDVEEKIHDDGVITAKQPDVYSQASLTKYRKDFEQVMEKELSKFTFMLSARVARSDTATFLNQTALAGSLTSLAPSAGGGGGGSRGSAASAATSPTIVAFTNPSDVINERNQQQQIANNLLATPTGITTTPAFSLLGGKAFQGIANTYGGYGIEPNVYLDQEKSYLDHLNQWRRVNMGADNADAAGYGFYLIRVPISIQPGECTYKGHGAVMTITAKHWFPPRFLPETFRVLVVGDLLDVLSPIIYEMIRRGYIENALEPGKYATQYQAQIDSLRRKMPQKIAELKALEPLQSASTDALKKAQQDLQSSDLPQQISLQIIQVLEAIRSSLATVPGVDVIQKKGELTRLLDSLPGQAPQVEKVRQELNSIVVDVKSEKDTGAALKQLRSLLNRNPDTTQPGNAEGANKPIAEGLPDALQQGIRDSVSGANRPEDLEPLLDLLQDPAPQREGQAGDQAQSPELKARANGLRPALETLQQKLRTIEDRQRGLEETNRNLEDVNAAVAELRDEITKLSGQLAPPQPSNPDAFNNFVATFLPMAGTGTDFYPIPPTDCDDVFLRQCLVSMARAAHDARLTDTVRFTDVRAFLKRELMGAFELLPYFEPMIAQIHQHVVTRDWEALQSDYARLTMLLPGELRGQRDRILAALCWAIAVDSGLLNRQIGMHLQGLKGRNAFACPDPASLVFYWHDYLADAPEPAAFQDLIRQFWPILAFAIDPVVDEQNIAEATSTRRDLQLALAFAFAAGRISFNNLTRYIRHIEYDAETIDLNRTIASFTQGKATFGWRFSPRFQTPPPDRSNFQTISNLLIRGGQPGRNYQLKNSKLEPGQRELTAAIIMPSFVPYVEFWSTGNWFWLHDPEQLKVPTARMLAQGQQVEQLKQVLGSAYDCGAYREGDLTQVRTRIDQVEEILPMQSYRVNIPYSDVSGFELFPNISGAKALSPQLFGFEGADYVDPANETDLILYGKRFSILETQVVAGGKYLTRNINDVETSHMDIMSREVMRVLIPQGVKPTVLQGGKKYVELFVATPNGVSNRLVIPYGPSSAPQPAPEPLIASAGYTLSDTLLRLAAEITPDQPASGTAGAGSAGTGGTPGAQATTIQTTQSIQVNQGGAGAAGGGQGAGGGGGGGSGGGAGGAAPKVTATAAPPARGARIRIVPQRPPARSTDTITADFRFPIPNATDTVISVQVAGIPYRNGAYVIEEDMLHDPFATDLIGKLDDFGKLSGQNPAHDLTTKSILITVDGSNAAAETTSNQLRVNIELYVQRKKQSTPASTSAGTGTGTGTPAAGGSTLSATATDSAGRSMSATLTTTPAASTPTRTNAATPPANQPATGSHSSGASAARPLDSLAGARRDPGLSRTSQGPVVLPPHPARAPALPGLERRSVPVPPVISPRTPAPGAAPAPPRPATPTAASPPRRSLFSRITGGD